MENGKRLEKRQFYIINTRPKTLRLKAFHDKSKAFVDYHIISTRRPVQSFLVTLTPAKWRNQVVIKSLDSEILTYSWHQMIFSLEKLSNDVWWWIVRSWYLLEWRSCVAAVLKKSRWALEGSSTKRNMLTAVRAQQPIEDDRSIHVRRMNRCSNTWEPSIIPMMSFMSFWHDDKTIEANIEEYLPATTVLMHS